MLCSAPVSLDFFAGGGFPRLRAVDRHSMSLARPWVVLPIGPNGCDTGDEVTYWQHTGYAISNGAVPSYSGFGESETKRPGKATTRRDGQK